MPATRFRKDHELTRRMVLVFVLVIAFHALLFAYFAWTSSVTVAAAVIGGALLIQWYVGDRVALGSLRARVVTAQEAPRLHGILDRLCALADMPKPSLAICDQPYANAFAVGRSPRRATVCVTQRLLHELDPDELEAVLAHELAHVAHRDVVVMTGASSFRLLVEALGRLFRKDGRQSGKVGLLVVVLWFYALIYYISGMLGSALSRYRELSADRSAAYLTGNPSALASAVSKLSDGSGRIPSRDLRDVGAVGEMFFVAVPQTGRIRSRFVTHPPVAERLDAIASVAADLGRPLA